MKSLIKIFAVAALATGLTVGLARAVPTLNITADLGSTWTTITDNGIGDSNAQLGVVSFNGTIGTWTVVFDMGQTKPSIGSATSPSMDLGFIATGVGTLDAFFTDSGFTVANAGVSDFIGGTIGTQGGTVADYAYKNWAGHAAGPLPSSQQLLTHQIFSGGGDFSDTTYGTVSLNPADTLTLAVVIVNRTPGVISGDKNVTVPDGGTTALLLGLGLLGMGLVLRSKRS